MTRKNIIMNLINRKIANNNIDHMYDWNQFKKYNVPKEVVDKIKDLLKEKEISQSDLDDFLKLSQNGYNLDCILLNYKSEENSAIRIILEAIDENIDLNPFINDGVDLEQLREIYNRLLQIKIGKEHGVDLSNYLLTKNSQELFKIRICSEYNVDVDILSDLNLEMFQIEYIAKMLKANFSLDNIQTLLNRYKNKDTIDFIIDAAKDGINLTPYTTCVTEIYKYVRIGDGLVPRGYYTGNHTRGKDELEQIYLGLKSGLNVDTYAWDAYHFKGDIPHHNAEQMKEIRLGMEAGLDVSVYAHPKNSVTEMKLGRLLLEKEIEPTLVKELIDSEYKVDTKVLIADSVLSGTNLKNILQQNMTDEDLQIFFTLEKVLSSPVSQQEKELETKEKGTREEEITDEYALNKNADPKTIREIVSELLKYVSGSSTESKLYYMHEDGLVDIGPEGFYVNEGYRNGDKVVMTFDGNNGELKQLIGFTMEGCEFTYMHTFAGTIGIPFVMNISVGGHPYSISLDPECDTDAKLIYILRDGWSDINEPESIYQYLHNPMDFIRIDELKNESSLTPDMTRTEAERYIYETIPEDTIKEISESIMEQEYEELDIG